jgi:hypothetical protein
MIRYELTYSDGSVITKSFPDMKTAEWFFHNEGDHLIKAAMIIDEQWDSTISNSGVLLEE